MRKQAARPQEPQGTKLPQILYPYKLETDPGCICQCLKCPVCWSNGITVFEIELQNNLSNGIVNCLYHLWKGWNSFDMHSAHFIMEIKGLYEAGEVRLDDEWAVTLSSKRIVSSVAGLLPNVDLPTKPAVMNHGKEPISRKGDVCFDTF